MTVLEIIVLAGFGIVALGMCTMIWLLIRFFIKPLNEAERCENILNEAIVERAKRELGSYEAETRMEVEKTEAEMGNDLDKLRNLRGRK